VEITLKRNRQERVAKLSLIGINDAFIPDEIVSSHPALLKEGMWGVTELMNTSVGVSVVRFKPMQATVNLDLYKSARGEFSLDEWRSLMLLSMGYNPEAYALDQQLLMLTRLLPLVQKNMTLAELAPKGTGKSYVYENVSPRVRLLTSDISPAVLFVNNATGQWGLLARFSVVVLDEIHKMRFTDPEGIVAGLQGYLANGELSRGGLHRTASDCGLVILANITLDEEQKPSVEPVMRELPPFLQETAFIDRLKGIIPGWRLPKLSSECLASSVGLKSDFFGDALIALRSDLTADQFCARRIRLAGDRPYIRNEESVRSIASGMMKILFPSGTVSDEDFCRYCLTPAKQLRQLVWDQLYLIDAEYRQYNAELKFELNG
jgi:ATP-dependent Lon protease